VGAAHPHGVTTSVPIRLLVAHPIQAQVVLGGSSWHVICRTRRQRRAFVRLAAAFGVIRRRAIRIVAQDAFRVRQMQVILRTSQRQTMAFGNTTCCIIVCRSACRRLARQGLRKGMEDVRAGAKMLTALGDWLAALRRVNGLYACQALAIQIFCRLTQNSATWTVRHAAAFGFFCTARGPRRIRAARVRAMGGRCIWFFLETRRASEKITRSRVVTALRVIALVVLAKQGRGIRLDNLVGGSIANMTPTAHPHGVTTFVPIVRIRLEARQSLADLVLGTISWYVIGRTRQRPA